MPENGKDHDINQVWSNINELQKSQSEISRHVAGLEASLSALIGEVKNLAAIVSRPQERVNWVGVGALIVSVLLCAAAYSKAILEPIKMDTAANSQVFMNRIMQLPDDYYTFGQNNARLEAHNRVLEKLTDTVYNVVRETERNCAKVDSLERWIKDVDRLGSRKHVISAAAVAQAEMGKDP